MDDKPPAKLLKLETVRLRCVAHYAVVGVLTRVKATVST